MNRYSFLIFSILMSAVMVLSSRNSSAQEQMFSVEVTGTGYPMILIPGLACSGEVWDATVEKFKDRYECHVLTLSGFGGEPPVETDSFMYDVREAIVDYIEQENLGEPVVMGHSLGGVISLWLAATHPDVVSQVIVVDALPYLAAGFNPAATEEVMRRYADQSRMMALGQPVEMYRMAQKQIFATMITDSNEVARAAEWGKSSDQATVAQATYELMTTDLRDDVGSIDMPMLVMVAGIGTGPGITTDQIEQVFLSQYEPVKQLQMVLMEHCRHFIMIDDPEWFFEEMEKFLGWTE